MSRASELHAQYVTKIGKVGQWIAIRRYTGTGPTRTFGDTLTRAYVRYFASTEMVGTVVQGDLQAIALVDSLTAILPVTTNDRLVTGFYGCDNPNEPPPLTSGQITGGKETAIKSAIKRTPGGTLIALVIHAVG